MSRSDRVIGIGLGLVIGVVAVVLFVFLGGPSSLDAPSLDTEGGIERSAPAEGSPSPEQGQP